MKSRARSGVDLIGLVNSSFKFQLQFTLRLAGLDAIHLATLCESSSPCWGPGLSSQRCPIPFNSDGSPSG